MKAVNKKLVGLALLGTCLSAAQVAQAGVDQPWQINFKVSQLNMANKSQAIAALGVPQDAIHISDEVIPEIDIVYFWTPNWATELVLTIPQKHEVSIQNGGSTSLGTFKHLPPTLSMQYHFGSMSKFKPYVSLGVNYTRFSDVKLTSAAGALDLERDSFGLAYGVGANYQLENGWYLNFDVKKMNLRSDFYLVSTGAKVSEVKADPLLVGFGVGWRF